MNAGLGAASASSAVRCAAPPLAGALMGELQAFQVRLTAKGRDTYAARSGEHDDLMMALACGSGGPVVGVGHARSSQGTRGVHPYSTAWLVMDLTSPWSAYDPEETWAPPLEAEDWSLTMP